MGVPVFQYNYLGEQVAGQIWPRTNLPTPDLQHYLCSIQLPFIYSLFLQTILTHTLFLVIDIYFSNYVQHEILGKALDTRWYITSTLVAMYLTTIGNLINGGLSNKGIQLSLIQINQEIGYSRFGKVP